MYKKWMRAFLKDTKKPYDAKPGIDSLSAQVILDKNAKGIQYQRAFSANA